VTVSITPVAAGAQEATTRPLRAALVGLGRHHPEVIEVRLHRVGVDQQICAPHA
jgi:hypothetical protein